MRKSRQIVLNLIVLILMVLNPLSSFSSTAVYAQSISDSNSAATVDVIARKLWQGGPEEKPELWFRLMFEEGEDLEVVPGVLPKEITDTENEVTWFSLPKYNAEGTEIIYKVQEGIWDYLEEEFEEGVPEGYRARYSFDGLTIRNIFIEDEVQPPALDPVIRETEIPVTTPEPPEGPGDEAPIDLPVITPEPDEPPLEEPRLSSPVTASINWQGGEVPRPVFWLKLQKTDASGNLADVPGASLIQANLATRVTWANIADYGESTDYTVVVVDSAGAPYTLPGYITSIEGLSVTFTYEEHTTTELVAELEWLASLEPKEFIDFSQYPDYQTPPVYLRLYRQTNESDEPIALLSTTLIELTHGTTTAIWYNMPTANSDGLPYIYSVKQVDANGNDFIPEGFEKIETGLLVQNVVLDGDNNPLIIDPGPYHTYNFYVQDNANNWQIEETQTVTNGAWLDRPEDPNKENHKFIGWFTDETAGIEFTNFGTPITVTENQTINLYARFVEQYTVTFYKHDGAVYKVVADVPGTVVTTTGVSYEVGQDLVVVGWSLTPAPAPQTPVYEVTIGYEPIALYPIVSNVYTIVFNSNLPHDNPSYTPPVYVVPGEAIQAPTNPTVVGYTFAGWNTQADGTGDMVSFPYTPVSNITLYAQWTPQQVNFKIIVYKEVLDGNGYVTNPTQYTAHTILEKQVLAGSELTPSYIVSQIGTNNPGNLYEFDHAEGVSHVVGDGSTVVGAYYKLKVYEFRFDLIRSDTSLTIGGQTYTGSEYYFNARMGENIASKWPTDVTGYMLSGVQYQFYAWYNSNIGSYFVTKRFNITTDMVPNPNTTSAIVFNAQYQTGMTQRQVNYYLQNVNDNNYTLSEEYSQSLYLPPRSTLNPKALDGFVFSHRNDGTNVYNFYYNRNTRNLYFFNYNYTDKTVPSIKFGTNLEAQYYVPPRPSGLDENYTFEGWYVESELITPFVFAGALMPDYNMTLYAKWEPITHTVTFDLNGGTAPEGSSESYANQEVIHGNTATQPTADPVKAGYVFGGWYLMDDGGNLISRFNFSTQIMADTNLKVRWIPVGNANIVYNAGAGSNAPIDNEDYAYGAEAIVLNAPSSPAGYIFIGWQLGNGTVLLPGDSFEVRSEDAVNNIITLTAIYEEITTTLLSYYYNAPVGVTPPAPDQYDIPGLPNNSRQTAETLANLGWLVAQGFEFAGWNTKADGSGEQIAAGSEFNLDNRETNQLYAQWTRRIAVAKVWNDANNQDGIRPASVTVQLYADGAVVAGKTLVLNGANSWTGAFTNLPVSAAGVVIVYTVDETEVPNGYTKSVSGDVVAGYTITNTHIPEVITVAGSKTWNDFNNTHSMRPESITINLYKTVGVADPVLVESKVVTAAESWAWSFTNQPKFEGGVEIVYTITENAVPGYSTVITGFNVANTLIVADKTATKLWKPDTLVTNLKVPVTVDLYRYTTNPDNATLIDTKELSSAMGWSYTWVNMPEKDINGDNYTYYIVENPVPLNFKATYSADRMTVTNTYVPPTAGSATATKTWKPDGLLDTLKVTVWFKLYRNISGGPVEEVPLSEAPIKELPVGTTSVTWNDLTETDNDGNPYTFTVKEVNASGADWKPVSYTKSENGLTVTNTYHSVVVEGSKTWEDNDDQDGIRPSSIKIRLLSDGVEIDSKTVTAADGWAWSFTNLPMYRFGDAEIVYSITEDTIAGYDTTISGYNVTNTHTPAITSKTVSKAWVDNNNQDGLRVDVTLKLVATVDGVEVPWADLKAASASGNLMDDDGLITLTGKINEGYTFENLPEKYLGKDVVYTVLETTVPAGYTVSYNQTTLTVTNTYTPDVTSRTVSKAWVDNNDQDGLRTSVTLQLVATVDGVEVPWADLKAASASGNLMDDDGLVTLTGKINESATFSYLPKKYQGKDVIYTVLETTVPTGYTVSYDQTTLTVTNTHTPAITSKTVSKAWVDNNNQDGLRVNVTLKLVATVDGVEVPWADLKAASASGDLMDDDGLITLTGKINEGYTFENLPEKYLGKDVVYTVLETTIPAEYTESYDQATLTVTNTYVPKTTSRTVSKVWADNNNQDGLRTDVTLKLVATVDGVEVPWADLKAASATGDLMDDDGLVTLTGKINEGYTFENLPEKYLGKDVVYTVLETTVPAGYTVSYNQTTLTVTNTYTPDVTSRTVSKAWVDNNDQDGLRMSVTLQLVATVDGVEVAWADLKAASASGDLMDDDGLITLTGKINEGYTFENLPEKYLGKDVVYTVLETTVPTGYTVSYDQTTLTVTNTHTPAITSKTVSKAWVDNNNQDGLRVNVTLKLVATVDGVEVPWVDLKAASASGDLMDDDGLITLTGKINEGYTFENLPEKYLGKDVVYTVLETTIPAEYTESYDQATLTVTNTYVPKTTSRTVSKVWADNNNQDGLRTDVTLKLVATVDGVEVPWADLKAASATGDLMDDDGLVTLTGKINESFAFTNLPEKYQGKEVVYTVLETTVPDEYTASYDQDTLTVTNTYTPDVTSRTVSKVWADNNNQDGLRTDVTLKLVATVDGVEVPWADLKAASATGDQMDDDGLITLTGKINESATFSYLPKKYQGKEVVYTVLETTVPAGYTVSYDQSSLTVTNTHTPAITSKTVSKVWDDNNNQDGLRVDVTLQLVATVDGVEVPWADLKAASATGDQMDDDGLITLTGKINEGSTFENLPEKYQGKDVVYTVLETTVPAGYTVSYDQSSLTVTNTHTPAITSKTVSKAWVDNNNQDGLRTDVTLKLVATVDGVEVPWADLKAASASGNLMDDDGLITLTGKINESFAFTNLPEKYQGKDVVYTVLETTVPAGYTVSYDQSSLTVTNTHTPAITSKTVSKVWADNNNQDGLRVDVTLQLVATVDGVEVPWADLKAASATGDQMDDDGLITLTGKINESFAFTNLPEKYQGKDVVYTVLETTVPAGYTVSYDQSSLTVTNTHTPAITSKTVSKVWDDNNNQDGLRVDVTLQLVATVDGVEVPWADLKAASASGNLMDDDGLVTLTGKIDESATFDNLPKMYQGKEVVYTVLETTVPDEYTASYDQDTLTVTNTYTPDVTSRTVSKVWDDNNNQDGLRVDVTLQLVATVDGVEVPWADLKAASATGDLMDDDGLVTLTGKINESATFSYLPKKYQGKDVVYTVAEPTVPAEYTVSYDQSSLTVTNTHIPEVTSRMVSKVWDDNNNQDGLRVDVTLKLVATVDGVEVAWADLKAASASGDLMDDDGLITLTGNINESYTFTNLPEKYQGKDVVYTVAEPTIPAGYTVSYDQSSLTVTNTHVPAETSLIITKIWADYDNLHNLRPESITVNLFKKVGEADPVFVTSQVVTATDGWAWTFADLPRYEDGVLIVYSITENEIPAYTTEINGFTITNTLIVNDQTATKTWKPDGLLARMRFDVEFQLYRYTTNPDTPEPVGTPVILSAPDWNYTWANMPTMDVVGNPYTYYVVELTVLPPGFSKVEDGMNVTNIYDNEDPAVLEDVTATKTWMPDGLIESMKFDVEFQLYRYSRNPNRSEAIGGPVTLSAPDWNYTWADLPSTDPVGYPYTYYVVELTTLPPGFSKVEDGLNVTNIYDNEDPAVTEDLTATKTWMPEGLLESMKFDVEFQLYRYTTNPDTPEPVGLAVILSAPDWNYTWTDMPTTDPVGNPYTYYVVELSTLPPGFSKVEDGLNVTNIYDNEDPAVLENVTATKTWLPDGLLESMKYDVEFQLYRYTIDPDTPEAIGGPVTLSAPDWNYTWADMLTTDTVGNPYTYYVVELTPLPPGFSKVEDGLNVTNTYDNEDPAVTEDLTATKTWMPEGLLDGMKFDVEFQLFRYTTDQGTKEVVGATVILTAPDWSYTWVEMPTTDPVGNPYTYYVVELTTLPPGFSKIEDGLNVTNIYDNEDPAVLENVIATKTWLPDGLLESMKFDVEFQLFRYTTDPIKSVAIGGPVTLVAPDWNYTWTDMLTTDEVGNPYTYNVIELTPLPDGFKKTEDGLNVTNEYMGVQQQVIAEKVWVGGPVPRQSVWFRLWRTWEYEGTIYREPVPGAEIKHLPDGVTMVIWEDVDSDTIIGIPYTFYVKEVSADGFDFTPENYDKLEDGLTVTNTYVPPTMVDPLYMNKVWNGGKAPYPAIYFHLYRQIEGGIPEPAIDPVELDGVADTNCVSACEISPWRVAVYNLPLTDFYGNPYTYSVRETDANGNDYTPKNYVKSVIDFTITNTYVPPKIDLTMTKVWEGGPEPKPTIRLQLYRDGQPYGHHVRLYYPNTTYTWKDLDETDFNGLKYRYTVDEYAPPAGYSKSVVGMTITNTYYGDGEPPFVPYTGDANSALLYGVLAISSLVGFGAIVVGKRRKKK